MGGGGGHGRVRGMDRRGGRRRGDRDGGGMGAALQSRRREVKKAAGIKERRGVFWQQ